MGDAVTSAWTLKEVMNVCVQRASKSSITKESALVSVLREEINSIVGVFILRLLTEADIDFIDIK